MPGGASNQRSKVIDQMDLRTKGIIGSTVLFGMAGCLDPEPAPSGTADTVVADTASDTGGNVDTPQADTPQADTAPDVDPPDVAVDTGTPDAVPDAVMPDVMLDVPTTDAVLDAMEEVTVPDTSTSDVAADAVADAEVCEEPSETPEELLGNPCDQPGWQALCREDDPYTTAVYCSPDGVWVEPTPGDFCEFCNPMPCDWDFACAAIGYIGIAHAGFERAGIIRLRLV